MLPRGSCNSIKRGTNVGCVVRGERLFEIGSNGFRRSEIIRGIEF